MAIRVLLADDTELIRKVIKNILKEEPEIEVMGEASSYKEAILLAAELKPDVVVLDLHLGDEKEVSPAQIKAGLAGSHVLAISVWNDDGTRALAAQLGAIAYLDKTTLATELIPVIKRLGGNPISMAHRE